MAIKELNFHTLVAPFSFGRLRLHTDIGYRWGWSLKTPDKKLMWGYHHDKCRAANDARLAMQSAGADKFELVKLQPQ